MNKRIIEIRKHLYLSHHNFAESINISVNNLLQMECGKLKIPETIIDIICKKYNINENWLRYGNGSMFDDAFYIISTLENKQLTTLQIKIIKSILNLDSSLVNDLVKSLSKDLKFISNYIDADNVRYNEYPYDEFNLKIDSYQKELMAKKKGTILLV